MEYPFRQEDFFDEEHYLSEFDDREDESELELEAECELEIKDISGLLNNFINLSDIMGPDGKKDVARELIPYLLKALPGFERLTIIYNKHYDCQVTVASHACILGEQTVIEAIFKEGEKEVESIHLVYAADNGHKEAAHFLWNKVENELTPEALKVFYVNTLTLFMQNTAKSPSYGFSILKKLDKYLFHSIDLDPLVEKVIDRIDNALGSNNRVIPIQEYEFIRSLFALIKLTGFKVSSENSVLAVRVNKKQIEFKDYQLADGDGFYQKTSSVEEEMCQGGFLDVFTMKGIGSSKSTKELNGLKKYQTKSLVNVTEEKIEKIGQLKSDFPNFSEVIDYIVDNLTLKWYSTKQVYFEPLLLVGKPGIGKTEFISELHTILDVGFHQLNGGSIQANFTLSGADATWSGAKHGAIANRLIYDSSPNFIFYLDEIDKTISTNGNGGDPLTALYDLLENRTAKRFVDSYYGESVTFNASYINFIASANTLDTIAEPILSRFNVFVVDYPTKEHLKVISQNIHERLLCKESLGDLIETRLDPDVLDLLSISSPREVKKLLKRVYASVLRQKRSSIGLNDLEGLANNSKPESNGIGFMATIQ